MNKKIYAIFLIFLVSTPVEILALTAFSSARDPQKLTKIGLPIPEDQLPLAVPNNFDLNPLHILCIPCKLVSGLLGGILGTLIGTLLGKGLMKQVGIFGCSTALQLLIKARFVPNLICLAVFEVIGILTSKSKKSGGNGICSMLILCPLKKASKTIPLPKVKFQQEIGDFPEFFNATSPEDLHENRIVEIMQSDELLPLTPELEDFNDFLLQNVYPYVQGTAYEAQVEHLVRNFVAAVGYQIETKHSSA